MIDHFNEIELLSVLPSVLQGSLASSSNHCRFYFQNLGKEEEGHNSQKRRSHAISFYRITLPDNVQMGSSTNVGFSYFYLAFLSLFFKAGRFSLSFPYSAVHPGYKLHVQYPEYTISPQSKCPFNTARGKHYIQTLHVPML